MTEPNIRLTDRDRTFMRACHTFRVVSGEQLKKISLSDCTNQVLNRRLAELVAAGYLHQPPRAKELYAFSKKRPHLFALGQRGVQELREEGVWFPKGQGIKSANENLKSVTFMNHQLGTVGSFLVFRDTLDKEAGFRFIDKPELLEAAPEKTFRQRYPWRMPTQFLHPSGQLVKRGTKPDYTFAIGRMVGEREQRGLMFLEFDNGTEDFVRDDPNQSMILGLYLRYADVYARKLHTAQFGFSNFRVLIVVNESWDRVHKMLNVFQTHVSGMLPAGVFVHTTLADLEAHGALAPIWLNGKGKKVRLSD